MGCRSALLTVTNHVLASQPSQTRLQNTPLPHHLHPQTKFLPLHDIISQRNPMDPFTSLEAYRWPAGRWLPTGLAPRYVDAAFLQTEPTESFRRVRKYRMLRLGRIHPNSSMLAVTHLTGQIQGTSPVPRKLCRTGSMLPLPWTMVSMTWYFSPTAIHCQTSQRPLGRSNPCCEKVSDHL